MKVKKGSPELFSDLLGKNVHVLREQYVELSQEEMGLRFQRAAGQLKDTSLLKKLRCRKARVKAALTSVCREKDAGQLMRNSSETKVVKEKK
jgi:ribosomal protein L29